MGILQEGLARRLQQGSSLALPHGKNVNPKRFSALHVFFVFGLSLVLVFTVRGGGGGGGGGKDGEGGQGLLTKT